MEQQIQTVRVTLKKQVLVYQLFNSPHRQTFSRHHAAPNFTTWKHYVFIACITSTTNQSVQTTLWLPMWPLTSPKSFWPLHQLSQHKLVIFTCLNTIHKHLSVIFTTNKAANTNKSPKTTEKPTHLFQKYSSPHWIAISSELSNNSIPPHVTTEEMPLRNALQALQLAPCSLLLENVGEANQWTNHRNQIRNQ